MHFYEDGHDELYNLVKGVSETTDLAKLEPDRATALRARLDAWLKSTDAQLPTVNPNYDPVADKAAAAGKKKAAKKLGE